ncbi:MAG: Crp/Fnr family transcriptional regulator [Oscillospiraceae bacterium]|nr:Crp/Fnr family transcriptional regulator [Oscillospiraceae bacterium]
MRDNLQVLKSSAVFDSVDAAHIDAMLCCLGARTQTFDRNDYVLRAGDSPESLGLLLDGGVLVVQEDFWGNRNIRGRITPGQVFAETFACVPGAVMDVSVVADESSVVLWLGVQRILRTCPAACAHHSRMIRNLLSELAQNNLRANEKLTHLSCRSTREKLLSYLSAEARRQGGAEFAIPFDRQQLADYLSVERSAMSAELSRMQREGLLSTRKNVFCLRPASPGAARK